MMELALNKLLNSVHKMYPMTNEQRNTLYKDLKKTINDFVNACEQ